LRTSNSWWKDLTEKSAGAQEEVSLFADSRSGPEEGNRENTKQMSVNLASYPPAVKFSSYTLITHRGKDLSPGFIFHSFAEKRQ